MELLSNAELNPKVSLGLQFRAVFYKNLTLTIRQRKSFVLFCILSIILMIVPVIVLNLVPDPGNNDGYGPDYLFDYLQYTSSRWAEGNQAYRAPYWLLHDETGGRFGTLPGGLSERNTRLYQNFLGALLQNSWSWWSSGDYCDAAPGFSKSQGGGYSYNSVLFTRQMDSGKQIADELTKLAGDKYCYETAATSGLDVQELQYEDRMQQYKLKANLYLRYDYGFPDDQFVLRTAFMLHAMNWTYSDYEIYNAQSQSKTPMPLVQRWSSIPPNEHVPQLKNGFALTFYWIFSMLVLSFLTPLFTQRLVLERQDGLVDISMMMGLSRLAHWLGHLVLDGITYIVIYALIMIVAAASKPTVALAMIQPWIIFSCLIFGFTSIATAYLISFLFRSPRSCLIFSYIYALVQFGIAAVFNMLLVTPNHNFPGYLMWWPPMNFYRLTYLGLLNYALPLTRPVLTPVLRDSMLCLVFETIIVIVLVWVIDRFAPTKLGNRGTTFNMISDFVMNTLRKCRKTNKHYDQVGDDNDVEPLLAQPHGTKDARVAEEAALVLKGGVEDATMTISQVSKIYAEGGKRFTAVSNVSFALREGDCFGLLGPNGAGKSTLVAMMSGILTPTSGIISVAKARDRCAIGSCPQDDIFYADLTVEEHLLYYSRLKGKGAGEDQVAVDAILADVSMQNERRLYASSLSGGQKRRLSVASALCGDPMVVFLDEPSSSLDPGSRIGLWEIVQSISKNRCTLLTTHSMEEAEVLCNKIGIIKDGGLVCLGTPSQLKQTYGEGYKVLLTLEPSHTIQPVLAAIQQLVPNASIISQKHGHYQIQLGREATLSQISLLMENNKKSLGVLNWSLSRNGLDEVFLKIVEDRSAHGTNGSHYGSSVHDDHSGSSDTEMAV
jgi:ABC-type multidrug transport system ATPase subunit